MSTDYWLACQECRPPHVHRDPNEYDPVAHSYFGGRAQGEAIRFYGWADQLKPDTLLVDTNGDTIVLADLWLRHGG